MCAEALYLFAEVPAKGKATIEIKIMKSNLLSCLLHTVLGQGNACVYVLSSHPKNNFMASKLLLRDSVNKYS